MNCSECRKKIPTDRLRLHPRAQTCSEPCGQARERKQENRRAKEYRSRIREALKEIQHLPLFPEQDTEMKVRQHHVVGLRLTDGGWKLAVVVKATHEGRATHASPAGSQEPQRATSRTKLSRDSVVAVLPPEWAKDRAVALLSEFAGIRFDDLEDLAQKLVASVES